MIPDAALRFTTSLHNFEATLLSYSSVNIGVMAIQKHLGITFSPNPRNVQLIPWQSETAPSPQEWSRVVSVLSAYRLLDVVALVSDAERGGSVEQSVFNGDKTYSNFKVSALPHSLVTAASDLRIGI